jgi:hypothetical protein
MGEVAASTRTSLVVIDGFLPEELATGMRADIEGHFAEPHQQSGAQQVWNYWFVPQLYTYLRTAPQKVVHGDRVARFHAAPQAWLIAALGMGRVSWPFLSLYIDGCVQGLHNDAQSGRFGFSIR